MFPFETKLVMNSTHISCQILIIAAGLASDANLGGSGL